MACRTFGAMPLSEPMVIYCHLEPKEHIPINIIWNSKSFIQENAFLDIACEKAAIMFRPQFFKGVYKGPSALWY